MRKEHLYNIFIADFETITENTKYFQENQRTGLTYGYFKHICLDGVEHEFNTMEGFFEGLSTQFPYRKMKVYFHNLSFDGVFILDWLGNNGYTLNEMLDKPKTFSVFRTTGSKIYQIKVKTQDKLIVFLCSKMLLSSSVKALGKCVNIDKYQSESQETEEFYNVEPNNNLEQFIKDNQDYVLYCKRDVEIVRLSLLDFFESIADMCDIFNATEDEKKNVLESPTISQISLQMQILAAKQHGINKWELYIDHPVQRLIMDVFTNGGLTIANEEYRTKNIKDIEGHIIDLKSAYPAVMAGPLPYGKMYFEEPQPEYVPPCWECDCDERDHNFCEKFQGTNCNDMNDKYLEEYEKYGYCTFYDVFYEEIKPKNHRIPLLKNWTPTNPSEPNYFLEATNYHTYLLKEEMEVLEQLYEFKGKKILDSFYFRLKPYLTDFVSKGFELKEKYKAEGNLAKSHTYKILLNSAYGIHAKRTDFKTVKEYKGEVWEDKKKKYKLSENIDLNKEDRHSYIPNNPLYAYDLSHYLEGQYLVAHKGIANYITAKTRVKLMKGILHFGPKNFVYCDTDSLFIINVPLEEIQKYCGKNLGDWEVEEKDFDQAIVMRSKNYQLYKEGKEIKQGAAGIKKGAIDLRNVKGGDAIEVIGASLVPHRVPGGLILTSINKILNFNSIVNLKYTGEAVKEFKGIVEQWKEKKDGNKG